MRADVLRIPSCPVGITALPPRVASIFNAVRGTIVTTSRFAKGTQKAALEPGTAPITLIDGGKLIDLLIEHGIGVRKRTVELLELDAAALSAVERDN